MIQLKSKVNKSEIMRELKKDAEVEFKNAWQKNLIIRVYLKGANDLFKKLHKVDNLTPLNRG
jgi:hypothetical protein